MAVEVKGLAGWLCKYSIYLSKPTFFSSLYSGFGSQMANTPMVIMWMNSDGSATLSQRKAPTEVMPTVDPSPPRTASMATNLNVVRNFFGYVYYLSKTKVNNFIL